MRKVKDIELYKQPSYKDFKNKKDIITLNTGKDIHYLDNERNKKHFLKNNKGEK